jgi:hypothetical protein
VGFGWLHVSIMAILGFVTAEIPSDLSFNFFAGWGAAALRRRLEVSGCVFS